MRGSCYIISGLFLIFILGTLVEAQLPAPRLDSFFPMGCKAGGSVDIIAGAKVGVSALTIGLAADVAINIFAPLFK